MLGGKSIVGPFSFGSSISREQGVSAIGLENEGIGVVSPFSCWGGELSMRVMRGY